MEFSDFVTGLKKSLTPKKCEDFDLNGYCVLPAPFSEALIETISAEVQKCFHTIPGGKTQNEVQFLTTDGPVQLLKPHIFECDLHQSEIRKQLPFFESLFEGQLGQLVEVLRERIGTLEDLVPFESPEETAANVTLKLQMNEGGSFPWHYDNPGKPNKRRLTMAVYLTEGWVEGVGGDIQLMSFLEPPVAVPPAANTVVLFRSDSVLHRTMPLNTERGHVRYCFTVWFDGMLTNGNEDLYLRAAQLREDDILFIKRSPVQRSLARAVYCEEFRQGIMDCFGKESSACTVALAEHEAHVRQIRRNEAVSRFVDILRSYINK